MRYYFVQVFSSEIMPCGTGYYSNFLGLAKYSVEIEIAVVSRKGQRSIGIDYNALAVDFFVYEIDLDEPVEGKYPDGYIEDANVEEGRLISPLKPQGRLPGVCSRTLGFDR